jgi:hypothetical protein
MKQILVTLFLLISFLGFGQSVSAPDPKSFNVNTTGQDASGFELTGFSSTETLLTSISLVNPPSGTTFYLNTTTGLTAASGFTLSGNKTKLVFTGTMASINTTLASLKVNTGSITGDVVLSVAATINPTGFFYNGTNGHFYKPVTATNERTTYTNARARSLLTTFKGQTGYLVTITSADEDAFIFANVPATNVWFAATDEVIDGRWVIDAGPEKGTVMKTSNGQFTGNIAGVYNNWAAGEPNGNNGSENYAVAKWNGAASWNDLSNNWNNPYVIEYGTWTNPDDATFTEFYTNSVSHSNGQTLKALFNFTFGSVIDKSKFSAQIFKRNDATSTWETTSGYKSLSGLGKVYLSNQIDTAKLYSTAIQLGAGTSDMTQFTNADIGKVYKLTTTGTSGGGWGTDIYTSDSYIPAMAVHAGVLTIGQTKEIYIKVVEGKSSYLGSTRNGITTSEWGGWDLSYQFVSQPSSYKAISSPGQVEWCVIYDYDASNQRYRVGIDKREFDGTNVSPNNISSLKLFDLWDGNVTFDSEDIYWANYWINTPTQFNYAGSSFSSFIRQGNGFYGVSSEFTFSQLGTYKQHKMELNEYDNAQLKTLYNNIVTVSDVYLAFKELSNTGLFGNQSGNEFGYGIQYINADVDDNGIFNEADCFKMLQNLTGVNDLVSSYTLDNTIKVIPDSIYNLIGKSTWSSFTSYKGKTYSFSLLDNVLNYNYNLSVSWKGDVNLSHSATPPSNNITTMSVRTSMSTPISNEINTSIVTELVGDSVVAYITIDPLQQELVGTQFKLNYDNSLLKFSSVSYKTKGLPTNYGTDKGDYINLGSLITDGGILDNTTEYKISFKPQTKLDNVLGLISVGFMDAVNKSGRTLKVIMK